MRKLNFLVNLHNEINFYFFVTGNIKTKAVLDVETKKGYWLTVYAQDHGVVPLSSKQEVSFNLLIQQNPKALFTRI